MKIFKEKPGVISKDSIWICIDKSWMYTADSLIKLIWVIVLEWKMDKNLVG